MPKLKRKTVNGDRHKSVCFNLRVDRDALARLRLAAALEDRTITNLVQRMINEGLERRK